jgi:hypothetical protein
MKAVLTFQVDTSKADSGVADLIERYRDLFELTGGREEIAAQMSRLTNGRKRVNRQMIEKWFRKDSRTYPSSVLLVTFVLACEMLKEEKEKNKV